MKKPRSIRIETRDPCLANQQAREGALRDQPECEVPCQHIADYYTQLWQGHKCIAWNLLRLGYQEWSMGTVSLWNNLYGPEKDAAKKARKALQ